MRLVRQFPHLWCALTICRFGALRLQKYILNETQELQMRDCEDVVCTATEG